jgi:hypothetical protein
MARSQFGWGLPKKTLLAMDKTSVREEEVFYVGLTKGPKEEENKKK